MINASPLICGNWTNGINLLSDYWALTIREDRKNNQWQEKISKFLWGSQSQFFNKLNEMNLLFSLGFGKKYRNRGKGAKKMKYVSVRAIPVTRVSDMVWRRLNLIL